MRNFLNKALALKLLCFTNLGFSADIKGLNDSDVIPNRYIVVLKENSTLSIQEKAQFVSLKASQLAEKFEVQVENRFFHTIKGMVVEGSLEKLKKLAADQDVAYIEADRKVSINETEEKAESWGLDRIDARTGLDKIYSYDETASDVHAYVIDTGINLTHEDFAGRIGEGFSSISDDQGENDCNGHGTHVAGTIGGTTYGVAKAVTLYGVRVLDCGGSGSFSGVISGIEWVAENAVQPAVANMSLGGGKSQAVNDAVAEAVEGGVTFVVAAGNNNRDACSYSPASEKSAITVGSTTVQDKMSSFSNWGRCVDIFAPGSDIKSAWIGSDAATRTISGTSMASPHVAGVVAILLAKKPDSSPSEITKLMISSGTKNSISSIGRNSSNLLVYNRLDTETDPDPNPTPCGDNCIEYLGNLSSGQVIVPDNGSFRANGEIKGFLEGPENANFDLILQKRNFFVWSNVKESRNDDSSEEIIFDGRGTFRWIVQRKSGSGQFKLTSTQ